MYFNQPTVTGKFLDLPPTCTSAQFSSRCNCHLDRVFFYVKMNKLFSFQCLTLWMRVFSSLHDKYCRLGRWIGTLAERAIQVPPSRHFQGSTSSPPNTLIHRVPMNSNFLGLQQQDSRNTVRRRVINPSNRWFASFPHLTDNGALGLGVHELTRKWGFALTDTGGSWASRS